MTEQEACTMVIKSLDATLSPEVVMMGFPTKRIIFEYQGVWFYLMAGQPRLPAHESTAVYGVSVGKLWAVSRNIRSLLDWADEREVA